MARATSKTISYDVKSPSTGQTRTLIERTFIKSTRVGGGYITAKKQYALFDREGRRYERVNDLVVSCIATGERFHIIGESERIQKDA